jgi:hypothetical protein
MRKKEATLSFMALMTVLLGSCGGEGTAPAPSNNTVNAASAPPPPVVAPFIELEFSYEAHRLATRDVIAPYTYAGERFPGGVADIFPQASISLDFEGDRFPEVVIPLTKAYGTPTPRTLPYLLLSNSDGRLRYDAALNAQLPSVFSARRSASLSLAGNPAAFFVQHNVSGMYNDPTAHGTAVLLAKQAGAIGSIANALPRLTTRDELPDNATDAHSMAVGDINGDGLDDVIIGNWTPFSGFPPVTLLQQAGGTFSARNDPLLERLLTVPRVNSSPNGNQDANLLIDLHLADVNGDGLADLIAGFGHGSTPSLLFINQNGTFDFDRRVELPPSVYGIDNSLHLKTLSFDIDNDGDLDLVIIHSRYEPYYAGSYIQLLRNDDSQFTDITDQSLNQIQSDIFSDFLNWSDDTFIRDVDGDGFQDILFSHGDGRLILYFNQGNGRFDRLETRLPNNEWGRLQAVNDLNADGKLNFVYYQGGGSEVEKIYIINVYDFSFKKP